MDTSNGRPIYRPSGQIEGQIFLPLALAVFAASGALGVAMHGLFREGWYFHILVPAVFSLLIVGLLWQVITYGRCRNRLVAGLLGGACGLLLFISYFHSGQIDRHGIERWYRLDSLPEYVGYRMKTDTITEERKVTTSVFANGMNAVLGLGLTLWLTVWYAQKVAARAYCESCGRWTERDQAFLEKGRGEGVRVALETGKLAELRLVPAFEPSLRSRHCGLLIEYCPPRPGGGGPCPCLLSVKEVSKSGAGRYNKVEGALGKSILRQVQLTPEEVAALGARFPEFWKSHKPPGGR
ncbi:MAG: hypothetical protein HZA54_16695 [Planctomycetes bacterium]|nr:hypothetical protein [Planctomycetota bacterium]